MIRSLLLSLLVSGAGGVSAADFECPAHAHGYTHQEGSNTVLECNCDAGYEPIGDNCVAVKQDDATRQSLPNLATDPDAARVNAARLSAVEARIANLKKGIALLAESNLEWQKERAHLVEDMDESYWIAIGEGARLASLGVAAAYGNITARNLSVEQAKTLRQMMEEPWARLPAERARLQGLLRYADPDLAAKILTYIGALDRLDKLRGYEELSEPLHQLQHSYEVLADLMEYTKEHPPRNMNLSEGLFAASVFTFKFAGVLVTGPAAVGYAAGNALVSTTTLVLDANKYIEERQRFKKLAHEGSDRQRMRRDLMRRLTDAEQERDRLKWAVERAR